NFFTVVSTGNTETMSITPAFTNSSDYFPEQDEIIHFGCQANYEIRVNGSRVMGEVGVPTLTGSFTNLLDSFQLLGISADTGTTFVAYDDIYLVVNDGEGITDFLGPVKCFSVAPNNTI